MALATALVFGPHICATYLDVAWPVQSRIVLRGGCFDSASYAPLARLPAGLVAADIDFGPFPLALTPHSVLAAPYHRLSTGIIAANAAFASSPADAERVLSRLKITYVVICGRQPLPGLVASRRAESLWTPLRSGVVPDWLELLRGEGPMRAYRLRSWR